MAEGELEGAEPRLAVAGRLTNALADALADEEYITQLKENHRCKKYPPRDLRVHFARGSLPFGQDGR